MIGPHKKKMKDKNICSGCNALISKELGGTARFPKKRTINYCSHKDLGKPGTVSFIKKFPYTPKWCPALKPQYNQSLEPTNKDSSLS